MPALIAAYGRNDTHTLKIDVSPRLTIRAHELGIHFANEWRSSRAGAKIITRDSATTKRQLQFPGSIDCVGRLNRLFGLILEGLKFSGPVSKDTVIIAVHDGADKVVQELISRARLPRWFLPEVDLAASNGVSATVNGGRCSSAGRLYERGLIPLQKKKDRAIPAAVLCLLYAR